MDFNTIQSLTAEDMAEVDKKILTQLNSDVTLINQLGYYVISAGGKRLRPMLAILAAKALNYQGDDHTSAAAFIEFIHTATLLHDDVVDESDLRRGKETANAKFGNASSVLVGDYIYTRAFQMMTQIRSFPILDIMSTATNIIAEGEVLQLINCNDPDITEESYMQVIYSKTARLFEAATQVSAILASASPQEEKALQEYGRYLGTAFQLIDDLMDYTSENEEMGKHAGDDLAEGKPTLPLLYAMRVGNEENKIIIRDAIIHGNGRERLHEITACLEKTGAFEYTRKRAEEEALKAINALTVLENSVYKTALVSLAKMSINRKT